MDELTQLSQNFILAWDTGVIVFLFFAAFFYGFSAGSRKLGTLLLSLYFSYTLITIAPRLNDFLAEMPDYRAAIIKLALFVLTGLVLFVLLAGSILRSALGLPKKEDSQLWHFLLLGIVSAGFLVSSALAFTPELFYDKLSTITRQGFLENNAQFWWTLGGIAALVILRKTKKG